MTGSPGAARVRVELGRRSYDIDIGPGLIGETGDLLRPRLRRPRTVTVTDATVANLHLKALEDGLSAAGIRNDTIVLPPGEATKDFASLAALLDRILDLGIDRASTLIALGGGVVGDIGGFAASIALRGIDYVQIPTTLLAQVDSSVGGKTGVNTRHGKNLVGSFHQPVAVVADTAALATLPRRELRAGYAEVVKYGLIGDPGFFGWLEQHGRRLIAADGDALARAVAASCRAKAAIVGADERESGDRALLNLGHTFAHALEAEAGYSGELLHGEAVAIGMVLAFDLSVRLGLCPPEDAARVRRHLADLGLPVTVSAAANRPLDPGALLRRMRHDKKAGDGRIVFVLVRGIGQAFVANDVEEDAALDLLRAAVAA